MYTVIMYDSNLDSYALENYKLAIQDNKKAQYELGLCYYYSWNLVKDIKRAIYWFKKSTTRGDIFCQDLLFIIYLKGEGNKKGKKNEINKSNIFIVFNQI
jgi:TPR repeat protein